MDPVFGPVTKGDGVHFRLWAPVAERVDLVLEGPGRHEISPMRSAGGGWFEARVTGAGGGTLYRYRIDGKHLVPDPASRFQPFDVTGPSRVVDNSTYRWVNDRWDTRPWHETVFYELHVGTFTPEGTYDGVRSRLGHLKRLGVTAIELMPLSDFPGRRNWGYDGVLPFCPDSAYGSPDDLKKLIDEAHGLGLAVFLDVVYNHFGPEGNYLHLYAPGFFTDRYHTPWGAAINFSVPEVRAFFISNAVYWLEEYRFDGLRLDAVHAIRDDTEPHILKELSRRVRARVPEWRGVRLVLENNLNQAVFLERDQSGACLHYEAQWNDDIHHCFHVIATGERSGYYVDYTDEPLALLGRCLAEGFAYQGEPSRYRGGVSRGEGSGHLPPEAFVSFLQNHDQIGNRALGERLSELAGDGARKALTEILLLSPQVPLLFMGEEWGTRRPFKFFCDFKGDLAAAIREGRRREFAAFPQFSGSDATERIPDPDDPATMENSTLDWSEPDLPEYDFWLRFYRHLLEIRHKRIFPLIPDIVPGKASGRVTGGNCLAVFWPLNGERSLVLALNTGAETWRFPAGGEPGVGGRVPRAVYARDVSGPDGHGLVQIHPWGMGLFLVE